MLRMFGSRTLVKLLVNLGTTLLLGPTENLRPISSRVRLLIQKLFWASDEGFKIENSFMRRSPDAISPFHSTLEILGGDCSSSYVCRQFSWRH